MWPKRKFDSAIQKSRKPIQDPELFEQLKTEFMKYYGHLSQTRDLHQFAEYAERALRVADKLVEMEPARAVPWTYRCLALGAMERFSDALVANEQAIEIDPSDPDKWDLRASILKTLGRKREAAKAVKQARKLRKA